MFSISRSLLNVVVPQVPGKLFGGRRAVLVICLVSTRSLKPFKSVDGLYKEVHS